jgi:FixJ family two-component response regulator
MPEATIHVVDDDQAVREGLSALLTARGYAVRLYPTAEALLDAGPHGRPGCLVVDVRMPGMSGLELQRELKRRGETMPLVVITGHGDVPVAVAALKAGAVDFLEKPFDGDALLAAIGEALARPGAHAAAAADDRAAASRCVAGLTPREREVMDLVAAGLANKVIAHRLGIAVRTVEIHRAHVMEKTGARSLSDLVRLAIKLEGPA